MGARESSRIIRLTRKQDSSLPLFLRSSVQHWEGFANIGHQSTFCLSDSYRRNSRISLTIMGETYPMPADGM